jgi:hypothetical protein
LALITPPIKAHLGLAYENSISPRHDTKIHPDASNRSTLASKHDTNDTAKAKPIQNVIDIDRLQANKDPNYNSAYAWSIARMKQDQEV